MSLPRKFLANEHALGICQHAGHRATWVQQALNTGFHDLGHNVKRDSFVVETEHPDNIPVRQRYVDACFRFHQVFRNVCVTSIS